MSNAWKSSPTVRFVVRALVTAVVAGSAIAGTIWIDNPYARVVCGGIAALGAYLGIGYGTPVEPFVGNKSPVEVPSPPAVPEKP